MKTIKFGLFAIVALLFIACGGGQKDKIVGEWKLKEFTRDGKTIELTDCDRQTVWDFTTTDAEPLSDGTKVQQLKGESPKECKFYNFDSKWMVKDGEIFISSCRIGGMGGMSLAGLMEIVELTDDKLVVSSMDNQITLDRK